MVGGCFEGKRGAWIEGVWIGIWGDGGMGMGMGMGGGRLTCRLGEEVSASCREWMGFYNGFGRYDYEVCLYGVYYLAEIPRLGSFQFSTADLIRPIRTLFTTQLAERLKSRKLLTVTFKNTLRRRSYEVHKPRFEPFRLRPDGDGSLAVGADEDTGTGYGFECGFGAFLLQLRLHDAELFDWGVVEDGG